MNNVAYVPVIQVCLICQLFDTIGIDSFVSIAHTLFIMFLYAADFNNAMLLYVTSLDLYVRLKRHQEDGRTMTRPVADCGCHRKQRE